jgi:hypothetical protein
MTSMVLNKSGIYALLVISALLIGLTEFGLSGKPGSLLLTLLFWSCIAQGCIALAAACELVNARWIASLRRELLSLYPLLLLLPLLFLFLWPQLDLYPWTDHPTLWLNRPFFMLRNLAILLAVFLAGRHLAKRSLDGQTTGPAAVIYLLLFVTSQTLAAFDWVMSLVWPWISTLLGAYFFTEALYAATAASGLLMVLYFQGKTRDTSLAVGNHLRDIGLLMFGFSVLWTGLFFAQFLLLWYGNLPEEVGYILDIISNSPGRELAWLFPLALFLAPFILLLAAPVKKSRHMIAAVSCTVLGGLFIERLCLVMPTVPLHAGALLFYNLLLIAVALLMLHSSMHVSASAD